MSSLKPIVLAAALILTSAVHSQDSSALPRTPAPDGATVYFISPNDGETVSGTFTVRFGLSGMGIAPAGIKLDHTGHHHLLVDVETLPDLSQPLPNDATHIHFGKGQTETSLTLKPGKHTLQLMLGDYLHIPHQPPITSERITVTVE
jgi:hypothetical protein